jgi:hypothetical protein
MCFGGGGNKQQAPAPQISFTPSPVSITPPSPNQLTKADYKPLQQQTYQPGISEAGSAQRRRDQLQGKRDTRRMKLSTGALALASTNRPSGGINL